MVMVKMMMMMMMIIIIIIIINPNSITLLKSKINVLFNMQYVRCVTECKAICLHVKYLSDNLIMTVVVVLIQSRSRF